MEPPIVSGEEYSHYLPQGVTPYLPISGKEGAPVEKKGMYFSLLPSIAGAKALSYVGGVFNTCTFRPVVFGLGAVGWLSGKMIQLAAGVTEVSGKIMQSGISQRVTEEVGKYGAKTLEKSMGVRRTLGEAADHVFSYIPVISGPSVTIERGEREAEAVLSKGGQGLVTRTCKVAASAWPAVGGFLQAGGEWGSFYGKKIADISSYCVMNPSALNHIFQNMRDKWDSYSFVLGEARDSPRPPIPMCSDGDYKRFTKYGKNAKKKVFDAVTTSSWLRISEEEKAMFATALKRKGVKRTDNDRTALRAMYSAYLTMVGLEKERRTVRVKEEQLQAFLDLPADTQDEEAFIVLSSPTWDISPKDRQKYQTALQLVRERQKLNQPIDEEAKKIVREMLGLFNRLPQGYVNRALTPQNFEHKLSGLEPTMARIRIMDIVRENASDLDPNERRKLAAYRNIRSHEDWIRLDKVDQDSLEQIILFHFNRLPVHLQEKLYDVTPEQIWDLSEELRAEFFSKGRQLLTALGIDEFDTKDPASFLKKYSDVQAFAEVLNATLRYKDKVALHTLVTPPPLVIAFTEEQLHAEIESVKSRLSKEIEAEEREHLSFYLKILESTLESRELFVPMEALEGAPEEAVFAREVRPPIEVEKLQQAVGKEVVTRGGLYTSAVALASLQEVVGTSFGKAIEKLAQGIGLTCHPAVVNLMFAVFSMYLSLQFSSEESTIAFLKSIGAEDKALEMEAWAANFVPKMLEIAGPLNEMVASKVASGITVVQNWGNALSKAMLIIADPNTSAAEYAKMGKELKRAGDDVCIAAMELLENGEAVSAKLSEVTSQLVSVCERGERLGQGASIVGLAKGHLGDLNPTVREAAKALVGELESRQARSIGFWEQILRHLGGAGTGEEFKDFVRQVAVLRESAGGAQKIDSLVKMFEASSHLKRLVTSTVLQTGAKSFLSLISPLMTTIKVLLQAESYAAMMASGLSSNAVALHLKWLGLAREAERYSGQAGDLVVEQIDKMTEKGGILGPLLKGGTIAASIAVPVAALGTAGFILTPMLAGFLGSVIIPEIGEYAAPRVRPMWNYLGSAFSQTIEGASKRLAQATRNIGAYLQQAYNSGRYIDPQRVENFQKKLSQKEQEFIYHAVLEQGKLSEEARNELEGLWAQYQKGAIAPSDAEQFITRLLLGFEDLPLEALLTLNPFYYSMMAPYLQARLVDIVTRYNPLTKQEKKSEEYISILVDHFKNLTPEQRAEIHAIPTWEYQRLTEEKQRELRFQIVHSQKFLDALAEAKAEAAGVDKESVVVTPSDVLAAFEHEPKGEELRSFLSRYQQLDTKELSSVTPKQLMAAGNAKILHALEIVKAYHARWIREIAETDGRDVERLTDLLTRPEGLSIEEEIEKLRLVDALASLCRMLPDHQQKYLLDMTQREIEEVSANEVKFHSLVQHILLHTEDPQKKERLTHLIGELKDAKAVLPELCSSFNELSDKDKAEFRQGMLPSPDVLTRIREALFANAAEILDLTPRVEEAKDKVEGFMTAAEILRVKGHGKAATHEDEVKIQRFELNAAAATQKLLVLEGRVRDLLATRSYYVQMLERAGVKDIVPLPIEEIIKQLPQRQQELMAITQCAEIEFNAGLKAIEDQVTLEGLEHMAQDLRGDNERRKEAAMETLEQLKGKIAYYQTKSTTVVSDLAKAKTKAILSILEKRVRCLGQYIEIFTENFSVIEKRIEEKRGELGG